MSKSRDQGLKYFLMDSGIYSSCFNSQLLLYKQGTHCIAVEFPSLCHLIAIQVDTESSHPIIRCFALSIYDLFVWVYYNFESA